MNILNVKALGGLAILPPVMAALLFGVAGSLDYWQAWTFLAVYFASSLAITLYLMKQDPALLRRRMRGGPFAEKEPVQRIIMSIASVGFIGLIVIPALDHRFSWSYMPPLAALAGDILVGLGWLAVLFVFRENSFSAATIELAPDQTVISTGPYAIVARRQAALQDRSRNHVMKHRLCSPDGMNDRFETFFVDVNIEAVSPTWKCADAKAVFQTSDARGCKYRP